jgi:hypothetical protein
MLWERHLEQRVSARKLRNFGEALSPLQQETANNYSRYIRNCLLKISAGGAGLETLSEEALFTRIKEYLAPIEERSSVTGRAVRSAIVGQFIPWCHENQLLPIVVSRYRSLLPLPFNSFSAPLVESFLESRSLPQKQDTQDAQLDSQRSLLRDIYRWLAVNRLGFNFAKLRTDARGLLASELISAETEAAVGLTKRHCAREGSASALILREPDCIKSYLSSLRRSKYSKQLPELLDEYRNWLTENVAVVSSAIQESREVEVKTQGPLPEKVHVEEPKEHANQLSASLPSMVNERRTKFCASFQKSLDERDKLIDWLIKDVGLSLQEVVLLERSKLKRVGPEQYRLKCAEEISTLDNEARVLMETYLKQRHIAIKELEIDSDTKKPPLFISADGGRLIVFEGALKGNQALSSVQVLKIGILLIQQLIAFEQQHFSELRKMQTDSLSNLILSQSVSRELRSRYLRALQTSPLQYYSISRDGPRIAFPAADGECLTADGDY